MISLLNVLETKINSLDGGQIELNSKSPKIKQIQALFSSINYKSIELASSL